MTERELKHEISSSNTTKAEWRLEHEIIIKEII